MLERSAQAKINLGLHVLARRPDGFHDIETVMVRIGWADRVRIAPAPGEDIFFSCSDATLPTDDRNTCVRAARLLARKFDIRKGAKIHLDKNVPYGAGLGSGSSDAASVLVMLSDLWNVDCGGDELERIAAEVGSDAPFFIRGAPAYATGRGTDLEPLTCSSTGDYALPFFVAVAVPPLRVSTASAYAAVTPSARERVDLRSLVCTNDPRQWEAGLSNDFELPVSNLHKVLKPIFDHFRDSRAAYVSLSGSGSAVYALFESEEACTTALHGTVLRSCRTWHGRGV